MRIYSTKNAAVEALLVLERHKIPVSALDDVLADIKSLAMEQPVTADGTIGLPPIQYEECARRILQELKGLHGNPPGNSQAKSAIEV